MTPKYPGTGEGSPVCRTPSPFWERGLSPWGRRIQISAIWAPNRRSGECPGDEIVKKGAHCFRENPYCRQIAGFAGSAASKKGPNGPNWRGDNSPHGLLDGGMTERGYGDPVRNVSTRETLVIRTLTGIRHPLTLRRGNPAFTPWDDGRMCRIPHFWGTKSRKRGPIVLRKPRFIARLPDLLG